MEKPKGSPSTFKKSATPFLTPRKVCLVTRTKKAQNQWIFDPQKTHFSHRYHKQPTPLWEGWGGPGGGGAHRNGMDRIQGNSINGRERNQPDYI